MDPYLPRALKLLCLAGAVLFAIAYAVLKSSASPTQLVNQGLEGECFPEETVDQAEIERRAAAAQAEIDLYYYKGMTLEQSYKENGNGCHLVKVRLSTGPGKGSSLIARVQSAGVIPADTVVELTVIPSDASEEDVGDCAGQWFVISSGDDEAVLLDKP